MATGDVRFVLRDRRRNLALAREVRDAAAMLIRTVIAGAVLCVGACKKAEPAKTAANDARAGEPIAVAASDAAAPPPPAADAAPAAPQAKVVVQPEEGDGFNLEGIAAAGEHLYWIDGSMHGYSQSRLGHIGADGKREDTEAHSFALAADADHVYIVRDDAVVRRPHAGGDFEKVAAFSPKLQMIVADGVVYGVTSVAKGKAEEFEVWRGAKTGKPKRVYTTPDRPFQLAAKGGRLYISSGRKILSMTVDGKDVKTLIADAGAFALDDAGIYVGIAKDKGSTFNTVLLPPGGGAPEVLSADHVLIGADAERLYVVAKDGTLAAMDKKTKALTQLWKVPNTTYIRDIAPTSGAVYFRVHPEAIMKIALP